MNRLAYVLLMCCLCAACGGSQPAVTAERARVTACQAAEQQIEDSDADLNAKIERLRCVRAVCDAMHAELVESVEANDE